ncbi:MAG TPA: LapA family protein, partial [Thermoleophilia bacterium]|nr:LapA family protein [Thermoleophilia bacterium]
GSGILLVLLLLFIFQNTARVRFTYLFWHFTLPLWLGLLITALVAFVVGQFALMWRRHKRRKARREAR